VSYCALCYSGGVCVLSPIPVEGFATLFKNTSSDVCNVDLENYDHAPSLSNQCEWQTALTSLQRKQLETASSISTYNLFLLVKLCSLENYHATLLTILNLVVTEEGGAVEWTPSPEVRVRALPHSQVKPSSSSGIAYCVGTREKKKIYIYIACLAPQGYETSVCMREWKQDRVRMLIDGNAIHPLIITVPELYPSWHTHKWLE
jgi:hypothetical protein